MPSAVAGSSCSRTRQTESYRAATPYPGPASALPSRVWAAPTHGASWLKGYGVRGMEYAVWSSVE